MSTDDSGMFQWAVGILYLMGAAIIGFIYMKTNKLEDAHIAHVTHVQDTYAKTVDMNAGFSAAAKVAENAAKLAETYGKDLNIKIDKTQESVHRLEVEQRGQSENMKNMDKNIAAIALAIDKG